MKRVHEQTPAAHELPNFLDDAPAAEVVETTAAEAGVDAGVDTDTDTDTETETTTVAADEPAVANEGGEAAAAAVAEFVAAPVEAPRQRSSRRRQPRGEPAAAATPAGGAGAMLLGAAAAAFGVVAEVVPKVAAMLPPVLGNGNLLLLGAVLAGVGMVRRRVAQVEQRLVAAEAARTDSDDLLRDSLQALVEAHAETGASPLASEDVQQVLLNLQRQDTKINNLTKALKMYGKPLLDIAGQTTELAGSLAQVRALVEGGTESNRQAAGRLETQLRSLAGAKPGIGDVLTQLATLETAFRAQASKPPAMPSIEPLQHQGNRLEVAVAAIAQRLEDNEVRKSLLRLEDASTKAQKEVETLRRGDVVREVATQLQQRFDAATAQLSDGMAKMRDSNLGGLENTVRDIQREVAGLATAVAQIQAAVKNGARPAAAPATSTAPAAPAPAAPAATGSEPGPGQSTTPAPAPAAAPTAGSASGYQTGARNSGSKNVLGAIAKLKQMKN
ncbi:MAG: hypothetical protein JNN13_01195 [Planctomycetes bacterium]|nr:hypothetical protein [Planctomycetota bacterium]